MKIFHGHRAVVTSHEVWAVIRARHGSELKVFSTFSDPQGEGGHCRMETTYSLPGADYPLIGARSTWDRDPALESVSRINEQHEYFLFVANKGADE